MTARIPTLIGSTAIAALLLALTSGCGCRSQANPSGALAGYQSDVNEVQVISAVLGGKNVFLPSTIVVTAGRAPTLSVFNTTDKPHGFSIPKLKIMEVLPDQVEHEVKLPALEAGIYPIHCHLHPAHRTATLLVVDD